MRVGKLGSVNVLLADTQYELFHLEDDNAFSVVTVHGVNRGIAPVTMSIGIKDSEDNIYWLENGVEILQKNVLVRTSVNLSSGDKIVCSASSDQVNFVCTGSQSSDGVGAVTAPALASTDTIVEASPTQDNLFGAGVATTNAFTAVGVPGAGVVQVKTIAGADLLSVTNSVTNAVTDKYGEAVAVGDFYLAVGAPGEAGTGAESSAGKVYIYETFTGDLLFTLVSPNEQQDEEFGFSLVLDDANNKLYVGAPGYAGGIGAVYRYTLSTGAYDSVTATGSGRFGHSLALSPTGTSIVVGSPTDNSGTGGAEIIDTATLATSTTINIPALAADGTTVLLAMGTSVATDGTHVVVGGPTSIAGSTATGAAQISDYSGSIVSTILPPSAFTDEGIEFGTSVTITNELIVVTAPGYNSDQGIAFAYLNVSPFEQVANINAPDATAGRFGDSVDSSDSKILLGAPESEVSASTNAGAVYAYREDDTNFTSRTVTATTVAISTEIDQEEIAGATFTVTLPYASNAGYDFDWSVSGYTDVIDLSGTVAGTETALSGTATTDVDGEITIRFATKSSGDLDFFDSGDQEITITIGGESTAPITVIPGGGSLYDFTDVRINGLEKYDAPSLTQLRSATSSPSGSDTWKTNTEFFSISSGIIDWTVPQDGTYRFVVAGAKGGDEGNANRGGNGATITGNMTLTQGQSIKMLVGGRGNFNRNGGGGGSYVMASATSTNPYIVAGGGGGWGSSGGNASAGVAATSGASSGNTVYGTRTSPGSSGNGGAAQTNSGWGGAGAGWLSNGQDGGQYGGIAYAPRNGGNGGNRFACSGGFGGFGGGGGGGCNGGGGGGGYNGGGTSGGGAGSYVLSSSVSSVSATTGSNTGNGYITIELL